MPTATANYSPGGTDNEEYVDIPEDSTFDEAKQIYDTFKEYHPAAADISSFDDIISNLQRYRRRVEIDSTQSLLTKNLNDKKKNAAQIKKFSKTRNGKVFNPNTGNYVKKSNKKRNKALKNLIKESDNLKLERVELNKRKKRIRSRKPEDFELNGDGYCVKEAIEKFTNGKVKLEKKGYTANEVMKIFQENNISYNAFNLFGELKYTFKGKGKICNFKYGNGHFSIYELLEEHLNIDTTNTIKKNGKLQRSDIKGPVLLKGGVIKYHEVDGVTEEYTTLNEKIESENDGVKSSISDVSKSLKIDITKLLGADNDQITHLRSVFNHRYREISEGCTAWDLDRAFTECISKPLEMWKVYEYFNDWIPTNKYLGVGEYKILTNNFMPFKGNGEYGSQLIKVAQRYNVPFTIVGYRKPNKLINKNFFKGIEKFSKDFVNTFIGKLISTNEYSVGYHVTNEEEANSMAMHHGATITDTKSGFLLTKRIKDEFNFCNVYTYKDIHNQIIDDLNVKIFEIIQSTPLPLVSIKCDCVTFLGKTKPNLYSVKDENVKELIYSEEYINKPLRNIELKDWEIIDKVEDICVILGPAGSGKSRLIKGDEFKGKIISGEHSTLQQHEDGETMHHFFGKKYIKGNRCTKITKVPDLSDFIIIEELTKTPPEFLNVFKNYNKLIGIGDFNQTSNLVDCQRVKKVFNHKKIELTEVFRFNKETGIKLDIWIDDTRKIPKAKGKEMFNITLTKSLSNSINKKLFKEWKKGTPFILDQRFERKGSKAIYKNSIYSIVKISENSVTFTEDILRDFRGKTRNYTLNLKTFLKHATPAYALNIDKIQGINTRIPYVVHEIEKLKFYNKLYTALSRCNTWKNIRRT